MGLCSNFLKCVTASLLMATVSIIAVDAYSQCTKINACSCSYGGNKVVDLSPLQGNPKWLDIYDPQYISMYSYNPCKGFTEGNCNNVAVCQFNGADYYELGTQESSVFSTDPVTGSLMLTYTSTGQTGVIRSSRVTLTCALNGTDELIVNGEMPVATYNFELRSQYCCPRINAGTTTTTMKTTTSTPTKPSTTTDTTSTTTKAPTTTTTMKTTTSTTAKAPTTTTTMKTTTRTTTKAPTTTTTTKTTPTTTTTITTPTPTPSPSPGYCVPGCMSNGSAFLIAFLGLAIGYFIGAVMVLVIWKVRPLLMGNKQNFTQLKSEGFKVGSLQEQLTTTKY